MTSAADNLGPRILGRVPSPPDARDYQLAHFLTGDPLDPLLAAVVAKHYSRQLKAWATAVTLRVEAISPAPPPPDPPQPGPQPADDVIWTDAETVLDQGNTPHCFPADTLIRLADGSAKRISEVELLDAVVTAEGRVGEITQKMVRLSAGPLLSIRLRGHSGVRCTPEHPILTRRGYVPALALNIGDEVSVARSVVREPVEAITFGEVVGEREYVRRGPVSRTSRIGSVDTIVTAPPREIALDERFGRLLGLYAAEGHGGKYAATWCYGTHESETLVPETVALVSDLFGATARVQDRPNNSTNVVLGGKHWSLFFERLLGKGAEAKRLHPALNGDAAFRRALLEGWIDGDGHRRRTETAGVTVSKALALDMHAIANDLGLAPRFNISRPSANRYAKTRRDRYEVAWGNSDRPQATLEAAATWRKVTAISEEEFLGHVYNLEVEGDHSYVADGIGAHNCVGFGSAQWGNTLPVGDHFTNADGDAIYYECKIIDGEPNQEDGSSARSSAKALQNRGRLKAYAFASSEDEIRMWVHNNGPIMFATDWDDPMFTPDANGFLHPDASQIAGGHYYVLIGDLVSEHAYLMLNSWGPSWGQHGTAKLGYADAGALLARQGEACAAVELPL